MWQILAGMAILPGITSYAYIYAYGLLILSVSVSIDLSRSYASATKNLEQQLVQVKALSDKALEQERRAKDEELSRRMLEADNTRKTRELDEARQVQLSMLPKEIPRLPQLDIAVKMETATEVGGDYYDFHLADDGALTIALGDATGHGTKAGTMVSITKGLFHELAGLQSLTAIFGRFTTAIKHMNLGQLYMGLLLVRIKDHTLTASAAGMPPIFLYRAATHTSELVVMKGMPLGQFEAFPYQIRELALSPGDTILLMSDGLIEMFNEQDETFDESRVVEAFTRVGSKSPQEIISHLVEEGEKWANGKLQADDVTLVVLKTR
jgi:serine phosphatase RsbU (regulator of sigma subunit)